MSDDTHEIKCAKCNVALKGSSVNPEPNDIVACPNCGISDTFENAVREASTGLAEDLGNSIIADAFEKATRGSDFMTFKKDKRPKKQRRFTIDIKF